LAVCPTQRSAAVEHRARHVQLVQVAAQASERIRRARQLRKSIFQQLALFELVLQVQQQRVQRARLTRLAQVADERGAVDSGRLGVEQAGVQAGEGAVHAGPEPVVARDRLDAGQSVQVGSFQARQ